nr:MAG TPA: hypothetical protein [Microviridae sp.]
MDMKKTRSIYCTDNEYKRIKIALRLMRVFDTLSIDNLSSKERSKYFLEIIKGDDKNEC